LRRSWRPRLGLACLVAGAVLLGWYGRSLAAWQQAALWGTLLVALAFFARRGWLNLFGPVLFYDLVRLARQGRTFVLRGAYVLALLIVLFVVYSRRPVEVGIQELADFGSGFFVTFLGVQFGTVFLLTPAFTATAIAEEKERRTLDYLLASDLRNHEIVLGKLTSRLLTLFVLLLGGLPVLSFVQFLGGVDPNLVLAGFAAVAVSMLSLGSLGILNSVYVRRPRGAVLSTYVQAAAYLLFSGCCGAAAVGSSGAIPIGWPAAGNIFVAYAQVTKSAAAAGGTTGTAVLSVLLQYVVFHGLATVICAGLAIWRLRAWNREPPPKVEREAVLTRHRPPGIGSYAPPRLPRVGADPILWKELYAEVGFHLQPLARGVLTFLGGALLASAGITYLVGVAASLAFEKPPKFATNWVPIVGTSVSCLMIVAVAMRASTGLSSERERRTLDSLLTTPLSNRDILRGKWLGSVLSVRGGWWALGAVWLLGFIAGELHPVSIVLLLAAWLAYAAFAAGLGLWFSLHCRTTLRATVWTLVTLLIVVGAPVLLCGNAGLALLKDLSPNGTTSAADLFALTPPGAMANLTFGWGPWYSFDTALQSSLGAAALSWVDVCVYGLAAVALWFGIGRRFGPITGRMS